MRVSIVNIRGNCAKGYFLPVSPGSAEVTIGGAVAADVHGKNHHKYGFRNHVSKILLIDEGY